MTDHIENKKSQFLKKLVMTFFYCSVFYGQFIFPIRVVGQNNDTAVYFQPEHGFFSGQIQVTLTTGLGNGAIYYTLDGSEPASIINKSTRLYEAPLVINKTCCIRAAAILANGSKSQVMTQTFLFVDDIIRQDYQATLNAGFPSRWSSITPDYGMDPDIVNDSKYGARLKEALLAIPSLSITMNIDDLFGSNGIYANSEQTGAEWERPGSVELIFPDQREGFQINCGVRIQGGWFRQNNGTQKHSFRLVFKMEYGSSKLRYPLFGDDAADRFDTIVLRAGANDGYSWSDARYTEQYTRDEFGRRLHQGTANVSPHGMFAHLYLNGIYWGLYNPVERPDNSFSAIYHGGEKSSWDAINSGGLDEGSMDAWNLLLSKCRNGMSSLEGYMEIQGNNPDGTRNPNFPVLLDVQNYIDYMVVNMWGGNWDWPWKNYRIARDRTNASIGFQFYIWDYENTMGNNRDRSPLDMDRVAGLASMGSGVGEPHISLIQNENYRMLFADRIQKHFFNGGAFTPESLLENYRQLASEVEPAIIPESARWGDQHYSTDSLTLDDWFVERNWILNSYLPQRSDIVLAQFRKANLYPAIDAPVFQINGAVQHGGSVASTDLISINAAEGTVYYTLDGTDPRLSFSSSENFIMAPEDIQKHVLVPQAAISQIWKSAPGFDVTNWRLCQGKPGGVGYERDFGYDGYITLDVEDEMYSKNTSCYIRIPFNLSANMMDDLAFSTLRIRYDDGFIAYLNGTEVARKNFSGDPQWNSNAAVQNSDDAAVLLEDIDISQYISKLKEGMNVLAIHGLNERTTSSDFMISAMLAGQKKNSSSIPSSISPNAVEYSAPFALKQTSQIKARAYSNGRWSALDEAVFTLPSSQNNTIISEFHYHPLPQDSIDESEFEFIELQNVGSETQNLSFARFVQGINYLFPANTILRPNEYLIIASDEYYFNLRYGFFPSGAYSGQLDNGGERIVLVDASGDTLISFRYDDKSPWPESADGDGYSLVLAAIDLHPDYDNAASWHTSQNIHGEPGFTNVFIRPDYDHSLPTAFILLQNYPNPFNSRTFISFSLPAESYVTLKVFDMMGREVATLVNEKLATGSYTRKWDASNVSSGVYFYRFKTNTGGEKTKKLLLIK
ncbi:MAG: T9SS C-terminal target domain-containing protein [Calditrichaeota bacterium]|nr:MAG: T9SS C-terminal target domain-containing protein [Calditrichota bacterium]